MVRVRECQGVKRLGVVLKDPLLGRQVVGGEGQDGGLAEGLPVGPGLRLELDLPRGKDVRPAPVVVCPLLQQRRLVLPPEGVDALTRQIIALGMEEKWSGRLPSGDGSFLTCFAHERRNISIDP
jgi:hypothetical protein